MNNYLKTINKFKQIFNSDIEIENFTYLYDKESVEFIINKINYHNIFNPFINLIYSIFNIILDKNTINYDTFDLFFNNLYACELSSFINT